MKYVFLVWLFCGCFSFASSEESVTDLWSKLEAQFPKTEKNVRILNLWPSTYFVHLAIEPAIPKNFVMKMTEKEGGLPFFVWGTKEVLDNLHFDGAPIPESVLFFQPSASVAQTGPTTFSDEENFKKQLTEAGITNPSKVKFMWGKYPVMQIKGTKDGKYFFAAWIGCNYCSNTLFVTLFYPDEKGRPNKEDIQLWETFLSKTTALPEPESFIAQGEDFQSGYSWFDMTGVRLLSVVERRKKDNKVQLAIFPQDSQTTFSFIDFGSGEAGTSWHRFQEVGKIYCNISKKMSKGSIEMPDTVLNVFMRDVDEFSINKEEFDTIPGAFIRQTKGSPEKCFIKKSTSGIISNAPPLCAPLLPCNK